MSMVLLDGQTNLMSHCGQLRLHNNEHAKLQNKGESGRKPTRAVICVAGLR